MAALIELIVAPAAATWILAGCVPSVRNAYANGWRCARRHPGFFKVPAAFALAYGLFQTAEFILLNARMGRLAPLGTIHLSQTPGTGSLARASLLPALESLAGLLNCLVATFPVSAVFAFLFLANWRGLAGETYRTLNRPGANWGLLAFSMLILCAGAAAAKPMLLLAMPEIAGGVSLRQFLLISGAINVFSFAFEYLLGTCLQLYLLLLGFSWVRGLRFSEDRLLFFAVRRLRFVFKWALSIILATVALVHAPLLIEALVTGEPVGWSALSLAEAVCRPMIAAAMLGLATVQIRLAFHNDTLREALAAHFRFMRQHAVSCVVFLLAAFALLFLIILCGAAGPPLLGETLFGYGWRLVAGVTGAAAGGWILAAWVCFNKAHGPAVVY